METIGLKDDLDMDEKTQEILASMQTAIGKMSEKLNNLSEAIAEIKEGYVTQVEFWPIKAVVYAIVSFVGLAFLGAIATLVFKLQ